MWKNRYFLIYLNRSCNNERKRQYGGFSWLTESVHEVKLWYRGELITLDEVIAAAYARGVPVKVLKTQERGFKSKSMFSIVPDWAVPHSGLGSASQVHINDPSENHVP